MGIRKIAPMQRLAEIFIIICEIVMGWSAFAASSKPQFKVIAFYTGKNDQAHISFVREANQWFPKMAKEFNFRYDSTTNWADLNSEVLARYQVVLFLDTRPEV